jgi:DNA mismatch endonuclease (patch repair protein)
MKIFKNKKDKDFIASSDSYIIREKMRVYLGTPPKASSEAVSKSMKNNTSKSTKPEIILRKALWSNGLKGYRLNYKKLPGSPDICYPKYKIAIFVNGCFWHRCPICNLPNPKKNTEFWKRKFLRNKERDNLKSKRLEDLGWIVLVFWECEIKKDVFNVIQEIKSIHS